uniref:Uncharacterized protein n=1 Tax=uncultured marine virus TaxID=186617 RepID=A0A0F7L5E3_9VIRU|nr:hypothetical protein [uncultured marine virus]
MNPFHPSSGDHLRRSQVSRPAGRCVGWSWRHRGSPAGGEGVRMPSAPSGDGEVEVNRDAQPALTDDLGGRGTTDAGTAST